MKKPWAALLDRQHQKPTGLVGHIGRRMLRQHAAETDWTVELLSVARNDRVLEVGFGAGRGLSLVLERASEGEVIGVDISPTMLRAAGRIRRAYSDSRRLHLVAGDVAALPFPRDSFDRIFSIHTLYFWPCPEQTLVAVMGLLVPGGRAVVTFADARRRSMGEWDDLEIGMTAKRLLESLSSADGFTGSLEPGPMTGAIGMWGLLSTGSRS